MAKRRKAPKRAAMSESEDEAATEVHEPPRRWQADHQSRVLDNEAQAKAQNTMDDLEVAGVERWNCRVALSQRAPSKIDHKHWHSAGKSR